MTTHRRLFTLDKANRALPLVARIVEDLVRCYKIYRRRRAAAGSQEDVDPSDLARLEKEIRGYLAELEQVGCELKDIERGLLDFRARMEDQEIYLCWQRGESTIGWWHPMHTGFSGRRPVSELPDALRGEVPVSENPSSR